MSKRELYRSLGVREYWQYDPTNDYLEPPLQGLELIDGEYRPLAAPRSAVLGLELRLTGRELRRTRTSTRRSVELRKTAGSATARKRG